MAATTHSNLGRRKMLNLLLRMPALSLTAGVLWGVRARAAELCSNPVDLTGSEQAMRTSLSYVEASPDAAKTCRVCSFFVADASGACGTCQILNGPANSHGHCVSWKAKS